MGLDVTLRPKNRDYDYSIEDKLSRKFCNFLCGPDAYELSEFEQLETLLEIDLGIFRRCPDNLEPRTHHLYGQLYQAEDRNDEERIKQLDGEIERVKAEWARDYEGMNEGWTTVDELEEAVKNFREKLVGNPQYYQELQFNFDWGNYFLPQREPDPDYLLRLDEPTRNSIRYTGNTLLEDLQSILNWIDAARAKGIRYVAFSYG
jgi:hypothetical protein